jgi:hypothetical protein
MKIYFAGTTGSGSVGSVARLREQRLLEIVPYRLLSFHYIEQYEVGGSSTEIFFLANN